MLYVHDVVLATDSKSYKASFFEGINAKYGFKDGGKMHYVLGINVEQDETDTYIHQSKYCKEVPRDLALAKSTVAQLLWRSTRDTGRTLNQLKSALILIIEKLLDH